MQPVENLRELIDHRVEFKENSSFTIIVDYLEENSGEYRFLIRFLSEDLLWVVVRRFSARSSLRDKRCRCATMSQWRLSDADQRPLASQLQDSDCRRTRLSSKFVIQICPSFLLTYEMTSSFETLSFFCHFRKANTPFHAFPSIFIFVFVSKHFPFSRSWQVFQVMRAKS